MAQYLFPESVQYLLPVSDNLNLQYKHESNISYFKSTLL